jgi:hypothetical protein
MHMCLGKGWRNQRIYFDLWARRWKPEGIPGVPTPSSPRNYWTQEICSKP